MPRARQDISTWETFGRPFWPGSKCVRPEAPWSFGLKDIDEQRSKVVYTKALMEDLSWLGLTWDEGPDVGGPYGPYIQQERYDHYEKALEELREKGLLYPCYCSRTRLQAIGAPHAGEHTVYDGHCYGSVRPNAAA